MKTDFVQYTFVICMLIFDLLWLFMLSVDVFWEFIAVLGSDLASMASCQCYSVDC